MEKQIRVVDELTEREIIYAYIEKARAEWLPHYRRAQRAGGMSAEANMAAAEAFKPIDILLDGLGEIALRNTLGTGNGTAA